MRTALLLSVLALLGCAGGEDAPPPEPEGLVGRWRSVRMEGNEPAGPVAGEFEFRADGTFHQRADLGFGVVEECEGKYREEGDLLRVKPSWALGFQDWNFWLEGNQLTLTTQSRWDWELVLERSDEPCEALRDLPRQPRTVEEAVATLIRLLHEETLSEIRALKETELGRMHNGLGMYIRNGFGLWKDNRELLAACGDESMHPDDASPVIVEALWKELQREPK